MNPTKAMTLLTQEYRQITLIKKILHENHQLTSYKNLFCFVTGLTTNVHSFAPPIIFWEVHPKFLYFYLSQPLIFFCYIFFFNPDISYPLYLHGGFSFGTFHSWYSGDHAVYTPSKGWIKSFGFLGTKGWEGNIYGQISAIEFTFVQHQPIDKYYLGMVGFTGIRINSSDNDFILGFCFRTSMGSNPASVQEFNYGGLP